MQWLDRWANEHKTIATFFFVFGLAIFIGAITYGAIWYQANHT